MGSTSLMRLVVVAGLAAIQFAVAGAAAAQDDVPVTYDEDLAAGMPGYDDEAAGPGGYDDGLAAGPESGSPASGTGAAEFSASAGTETLLGWDEQPVPQSAPDRSGRKPWEWGAARHHSNLDGTTGLLHMPEAGSGPAGTFGVGFHGSWFKYDDYLVWEDENTGMWGGVNVRVTPLQFLEIHYGVTASANRNTKEYPELFQALGDMQLGLKGFVSPDDWVTIGLAASMLTLNSVGEVAMDWSGTSFGLDALGTFDFAALSDNAPLRFHLRAGYFFDRAANLIADLESEGGGCGTDEDGDGNVDYKGCLSSVERTALGIDRNDQFRLAFGLDALLPYVSPMVEYKLEIPVNRQEFVCPKDAPGSVDRCMVQEGSGAFRQVLALGARVLPPIEDLAIDVGVDIGLTGYAPTVHELAAEVPWRIIFGLSYNFDPFPEEAAPLSPPPVLVPPPPPPPPPPARILGLVHDKESVDVPVSEAVVSYAGRPLNPQVAGRDGRFASYELPEGPVTIEVDAEGFHPGSFTVEVPATGEIEQQFPLEAKPKLGTISLRVVDENERPVGGAAISYGGPASGKLAADGDGRATVDVPEGAYTLAAEVEGYLGKRVTVETRSGARTEVFLQLRSKPKNPVVQIQAKRIVIKRQINFETGSDIITTASYYIVDEVADTLINNPQIRAVEIQGHTDDRGKRDYNVELSERRAQAVRRYLVEAGVESGRLEARGFGPDRPIAPNITGEGRARNRRVEFHITDRAE
jgi:outer membrane protein OmpA-like peptidoglycan-associated protein